MAGTSGRWRAAAMAAVLVAGGLAYACDTPVFQYALERWFPDPYPALVFHKGPLSQADQKLLERFREAAYAEQCNLHVVDVNTAEELTGRIRDVYERHRQADLPHVVVLYPERSFAQDDLWSGKLDSAALDALVNSPARREIARRILHEHHVGVWLLLESGNKEADDKAAKTLADTLAEVPKAFREAGLLPPEPTTQPADVPGDDEDLLAAQAQGIGGPPQPKPFKPTFSLLRISRQDPAERSFVRVLAGTDKGLLAADAVKQPMIFPIFARGRALGVLVGDGIESENILYACAILVGPCACEIKHQNPGVDLLFTANWPLALGVGSDLIEEVGLPTSPPATQPATAPAEPREAPSLWATTRPTTRPAADQGDLDPIYRNAAAALAIALTLAVLGGLWARRRARRIAP